MGLLAIFQFYIDMPGKRICKYVLGTDIGIGIDTGSIGYGNAKHWAFTAGTGGIIKYNTAYELL